MDRCTEDRSYSGRTCILTRRRTEATSEAEWRNNGSASAESEVDEEEERRRREEAERDKEGEAQELRVKTQFRCCEHGTVWTG